MKVIKKYIVGHLRDMYMSDVTVDDIRLAMVPVSKMSAGVYDRVNMLFKKDMKDMSTNQDSV